MSFSPKTIAEHIECLAQLTNAPHSFVVQVKALFSRKGISLEEEAEPYLKALDEAFRREEMIREQTARTRGSVSRSQDSFRKMAHGYSRRASDPVKVRRGGAAAGSSRYEVAIPGDHRTFVTRQEREDVPLVPGPQELQ